MESLHTPNCIRTLSGQYIDPFNPEPDKILLEDIAHALANIPRFGGHLQDFYSVARHSLHCFSLAPEEHKLAALLHDASEAYLLDIPTPIKARITGYKEAEDNLMAVIAEKFGFEYPLNPIIKEIDKMVLEIEWDVLMLQKSSKHQLDDTLYRELLQGMHPCTAASQFRIAFNYLQKIK